MIPISRASRAYVPRYLSRGIPLTRSCRTFTSSHKTYRSGPRLAVTWPAASTQAQYAIPHCHPSFSLAQKVLVKHYSLYRDEPRPITSLEDVHLLLKEKELLERDVRRVDMAGVRLRVMNKDNYNNYGEALGLLQMLATTLLELELPISDGQKSRLESMVSATEKRFEHTMKVAKALSDQYGSLLVAARQLAGHQRSLYKTMKDAERYLEHQNAELETRARYALEEAQTAERRMKSLDRGMAELDQKLRSLRDQHGKAQGLDFLNGMASAFSFGLVRPDSATARLVEQERMMIRQMHEVEMMFKNNGKVRDNALRELEEHRRFGHHVWEFTRVVQETTHQIEQLIDQSADIQSQVAAMQSVLSEKVVVYLQKVSTKTSHRLQVKPGEVKVPLLKAVAVITLEIYKAPSEMSRPKEMKGILETLESLPESLKADEDEDDYYDIGLKDSLGGTINEIRAICDKAR
ncbi:hypothetical protein BDV25DRAFT_143489 [Aspergillus avenaceus]|uniref:Uncharacterized protein n=1 Tax=Aspergillus avenaceus TaxID=36643 RepID=A0A5N6TKL5_ASPAV|nr:hypothetical protein BDV25DRAFT_143489 [Aspergillus avenaceus]